MIEFKQNFETYFSNPSVPSFSAKIPVVRIVLTFNYKKFYWSGILVLAEKMAEFVG